MTGPRRSNFNAQSVSYGVVGATLNPDVLRYKPKGFWASERSARLGTGRDRFESARDQLWQWQVPINAGVAVREVVPGSEGGYRGINQRDERVIDPNEVMFTEQGFAFVNPGATIAQQYTFLGRSFDLPDRVVAVVDEDNRAGYVLGTLEGHPLIGEQAFILELHEDDSVWFIIRQLSQVANPKLKLLTPVYRWQQIHINDRYLKSLHPAAAASMTEQPAEANAEG